MSRIVVVNGYPCLYKLAWLYMYVELIFLELRLQFGVNIWIWYLLIDRFNDNIFTIFQSYCSLESQLMSLSNYVVNRFAYGVHPSLVAHPNNGQAQNCCDWP